MYLRHIILFKFRKHVNVSAAIHSICKIYKDTVLITKTVRKWLEDKRRSK